MKLTDLKKTHEEITETSTVGTPGYAVHLGDDYAYVKIWDGNSWLEGIYRVDGAELIHQSEFTLLKKIV
jgi:hypothetical protein